MKSLMPWFCLVATSAQVAFADDGLDAYRVGNYTQAAVELNQSTNKDPIVDYYLGKMRLYGYGQLKNDTLAMNHFRASAERGFLAAEVLVARYALLKENNPEEALTWLKKAAEANDPQAQAYCAAAYLFGYGVKKNDDIARKYIIAAARNNNSIAQLELANHFLDSKQLANKKLGLLWLNKAVAQGNPKAQLKLAQLYTTGNAVERNPEKAKELINLSIAQGYLPAQYQMGQFAESENNLQLAKEWYIKAADEQYLPAQVALGRLLLQQNTPLYDPKTGYLWALKAAQSGSGDAQKLLADIYLAGQVITKDETLSKEWQEELDNTKKAEASPNTIQKKVVEWLSNDKATNLAQSDYTLDGIFSAWQNPNALKENNYNQPPQMDTISRNELYKPKFEIVLPNEIPISEYYEALTNSLGRSQQAEIKLPQYPMNFHPSADESEKKYTIQKMVENSPEQVTLYPMLENEDPQFQVLSLLTPPEKIRLVRGVTARRIINEAILGDPNAQFTLAQMLQKGTGIDKNISEAVRFYRLAYNQKDTRAAYNLGLIYLDGVDIEPNYQNAIGWLRHSAFKGNVLAQYALAQIWENGYKDAQGNVVIPADYEQAISMYYLAAGNYYGPAQFRLAELTAREKPSDVSMAAKHKRLEFLKYLYRGAVVEGIQEAALPLAFFYAMDSDKGRQAQAFAVAKEEASKGNGQAALLLGLLYDRGISVAPNDVEAIYWYQQAPVNSVSSFILGTYYNEGQHINQDSAKGRDLLQKSADSGFSYANLNLAVLKQKSNEDFLPEMDTALSLGNTKAGLLLADYYLSLANDNLKMQQARDIYKRFAERGDKEGQVKLGYMFEQGLGGPVDITNAQMWYMLSAEQGQPLARYMLGRLNQLGWLGKLPNYPAAKKWYESAQMKYPPASVALGFIYDTVENNYKQAQVEWA